MTELIELLDERYRMMWEYNEMADVAYYNGMKKAVEIMAEKIGYKLCVTDGLHRLEKIT